MRRQKTSSKPTRAEKKQAFEEKRNLAKDKLKETPMEKGDLLAMSIAALIAIMPIVLVVLAIFAGILFLFTL